MIEVVSAENPRFIGEDQSVIVLNVQFSHLPNPVEFAASANDTEAHGRDIHARALAGEFGEVAEYAHPTEFEKASIESPKKLFIEKKEASDKANHLWMMGEETTANIWRDYYKTLVSLENSPEWPLVEWPTKPL